MFMSNAVTMARLGGHIGGVMASVLSSSAVYLNSNHMLLNSILLLLRQADNIKEKEQRLVESESG